MTGNVKDIWKRIVIGSGDELIEEGASYADDVIKGSSGSILAYEDAENIAFDAIHGSNKADTVVLGKYGGPTAYTNVAKDMDAQYF